MSWKAMMRLSNCIPERLNEELGSARICCFQIRWHCSLAVKEDAALAGRCFADGILFEFHLQLLNRAGLQADGLGRLCWTVHLGCVSTAGEGQS